MQHCRFGTRCVTLLSLKYSIIADKAFNPFRIIVKHFVLEDYSALPSANMQARPLMHLLAIPGDLTSAAANAFKAFQTNCLKLSG